MVKVHICDEIMGKGKSSAFINYMNDYPDKRFVYITPYLDEVSRVVNSCKPRKFQRPIPRSEDGRLEDIHRLLEEGQNIASTHAMFKRYTEETVRLIQANGYTLVLDEAFSIVSDMGLSVGDIAVLKGSDSIRVEGTSVKWSRPEIDDMRYQDVKDTADSNSLILYDGVFMFWQFPPDVFKAFDEAFVLTYMFDAQMQKYYFDIHGIEYDFVYTDIIDGKYTVVDYKNVAAHQYRLKDLVHVVNNDKLNDVGDKDFSLSSSWYERRKPSDQAIKDIKSNLINYYTNIVPSKSSLALWTVFEKRREWIKGKGYTSSFESCNMRATSKHRHRRYLAYCINVFMNPFYKKYFVSMGAEVDEDKYALSEMVQWIWRSAIRDGKEIWVYVPSKRMRTLLINWLDDLSKA
ncbi:MAG: hypothetical protein PHX74_05670 [Candidatus Sumerlaeales bacterium]|nr:hypothetical protein [Candidatus Sumerlaeales bacterium]